MPAPDLATPRLMLRQWRDSDLPAFAALNADPRVMEFFPAILGTQASNDLAARIRAQLETGQFGLWAVEVPGLVGFAGFVGLSIPSFSAPFTPCVEVGWRLAYEHWGKGYASEGARAALNYGFETLRLPEVVSFTAAINIRSTAVMRRIGMRHDPVDDFDHPRLAERDRLRRHVLFRMSSIDWSRK